MTRTEAPTPSSGQVATSDGPASSAPGSLAEKSHRVPIPPAPVMGVVEEAVGHDGREQGEKAIAEEDVAEEGDGVAKETVRTPGFIGERESGSPLRVVVHCLSHKIPGPRSKRTATLANIICQHQFQRNMDPGKDKIKVIGLQDIDGKKVRFLLESGILPATATLDDLPILAFKWTGEEL